MKKSEIEILLYEALLRGEGPEVEKLVKKTDAVHRKTLFRTLSRGMETARERLEDERLSIPEFLLCIDAFRAGLKHLKTPDKRKKRIPVFIGVVKGDVHDLGKNIVAAVLDSCGYQIIDMGTEVTGDGIGRYIAGRKKAVIALSAMMSTSLDPMKDIIEKLGGAGPGIRCIVGGAALDSEIAKSIGAHGYAESVVEAPAEMQRIISGM